MIPFDIDFQILIFRLWAFKLFVQKIQFDVGGLKRGNIILAYKTVQINKDSLKQVLDRFELRIKEKPLPIPILVLTAGPVINNKHISLVFNTKAI